MLSRLRNSYKWAVPEIPKQSGPSPYSKLPFSLGKVANNAELTKALQPWENRSHITNKSLPALPTDIKGVDSALYPQLRKKLLLRNLPLLAQTKFFTLKFVDTLHHLSLVRKSNIAYTFSNHGAPILNDVKLEQAFKKYNGKYRKLEFFKTLPEATETAAQRIKYRKRVKRSLFSALHQVVEEGNAAQIKAVSGIFLFKFQTCPATLEDFVSIDKSLVAAVDKILHNSSFQDSLLQVTKQQNKEFSDGKQLLSQASMENSLGAANVPGYYPKLPFAGTKLGKSV